MCVTCHPMHHCILSAVVSLGTALADTSTAAEVDIPDLVQIDGLEEADLKARLLPSSR